MVNPTINAGSHKQNEVEAFFFLLCETKSKYSATL